MLNSLFYNINNKKLIYTNMSHFSNRIKFNIRNNFDYKQVIKESNKKYIDKLLNSIEMDERKADKININNKLELDLNKSKNVNLFLSISMSVGVLLLSFKLFKR
jgi:hypothetical protein